MVTIKGKQYSTVAERVKAAHAAGGFSITASEIVPFGPDRYAVKVTISLGDRQFIGISEIRLTAKAGTADGDAPIECAETSALGRALAFAGFATDGTIASADEMLRMGTPARAA